MKYVDACQGSMWHLRVWPPASPEDAVHVPFRCRSWRHCGECREWKGAQDWCRVRDAVAKRTDWVYLVLTYDPKDWRDWRDQYKGSLPIWGKLQKRITREYGRFDYIQTWERHLRGGLHVNLLIGNAGIHAACVKNWKSWRRSWLEPTAVECGYGLRTWVELFRCGTADAMAGYLTKLARELTGASQKGQIPIDAPPHFRRLRASRGLLPPAIKSDWTGELCLTPDPDRKVGFGIDGEVPNDYR